MFVVALLATFAVAGSAGATPDGAAVTAGPWIASDKPDYAPGERVTLSGGGWKAGESVTIQVDDDDSRSWSRTVDVTADSAGNIIDSFALPDWFVALYTVKATGEQSGTASTTFTDGNVTLHLPAAEGVANMTVTVNVYGSAQNPNTNCGGSPVRVETVVVTSPGGSANIPGFGNSNLSARLVSVSTTTTGKTFDRWTSGTTTTDSGIEIPGSPQPCISSGLSGSNGNVTDGYAHFKVSNTAPTCANGSATTDEDTPRSVTLSCTDPEGDALTYSIVSGPSNGSLSGSGSTRTYTPAADVNGSDSFTFRASDGTLSSATATFGLTVNPVNDAPTASANPAAIEMNEDGSAANVQISGHDVESAASALTFVITQAPANGTLKQGTTTLVLDDTFTGSPKTLTYAPTADFNGSDSFKFKVRDAGDPAGCTGATPACAAALDSTVVTVPITVAAVNDAPICSDGSGSTAEDTPRDVTLACSDVDGDSLTYSIVEGPSHGSLSGTGANRTYTPAANYHGSDSFTFKANDGAVDSNVASFDLTVTSANDAPSCSDGSASTAEDTPKDVTLTCSDVDGDSLTYSIVEGPSHGPLSGTGANRTYTPAANYHGSDAFTFKANDGTADSNVASFDLTITSANDAPVANDDGVEGTEDEALEIDPSDLLGNDTDVDGDSLAVTGVENASGGEVAFVDGVVTFTPTADRCGTAAASFDYTIGDGNGGTSNATVTIELLCVNDAPVARDDEGFATDEDTALVIDPADLLANDTDVDNPASELSLASVGGAVNGTVEILATGADTGKVRFTPDADYHGPAAFTYRITDGALASNAATVSITVNGVNDAPVAGDDTASGTEDENVAIAPDDLIANDTDVDGDALTITGVGSAEGGTVVMNESGNIVFTPEANRCGADIARFGYTVSDGDSSDTAIVTISLECVNDDPSVAADHADVAVDEGDTAENTGGWADVDGDEVNLSASVGVVTKNADGTWSWSFGTSDGPTDSQSVSVTANDGKGGSSRTTFDLTVRNVAASVSLSGATEVDEGDVEEYTFSVSDPGADTWSVSDGYPSCGTNGTLVPESLATTANGGSFRCRFPDGPKSTNVAIRVADDDGGVSADVQNVNILAVTIANVAPVVTAPADQASTEGEAKSFALGSFTDPGDEAGEWRVEVDWDDGSDSQSFDAAAAGSLGTLEHTYAQDGEYTVTVDVTDENGEFDTATFIVTVANVAPAATGPGNQTSAEGEEKSFALGSFTDPGPDGDWKVSVDWGDGSAATTFTAGAPGSLGSKSHAYADNGEYAVTIRVSEAGEGAPPYGEATFNALVANVAPTLNLTGASDVSEGDTKTYSFTVSDPGVNDTWDFAESTPSCGANGELVAGSVEPSTAGPKTAAGGKFKCFFPEGGTAGDPVGTKVVTKIVDKDGGKSADAQSVEVIDVNINNVAPTAVLGNDGPVGEGSPVTVSFTEQSDPSADDTAAGFRYAYRCDGTPFPANPGYAGASASASHQCTYGDNGSRTVRARIIDRNGGFSEYTTAFQVANVTPIASNGSFAFNPLTGQATAGFSFSDLGWLDSHAGSYFKWSIDGGAARPATVTQTNNAPAALGSASDTRTLPTGCANLTVVGIAKDDDAAESAPLTIASSLEASVHGKGFRPPIVDNERNIAKLGNVVPVKVLLQNACTGASVTNVDLYISLHEGAGDEAIEGTSVIAESVSAADTTGKLRIADGMYMYNLSTKGLKASTDYTVRIRMTSTTGPRILQAVIHPKR